MFNLMLGCTHVSLDYNSSDPDLQMAYASTLPLLIFANLMLSVYDDCVPNFGNSAHVFQTPKLAPVRMRGALIILGYPHLTEA
jgi:hypothetical protein